MRNTFLMLMLLFITNLSFAQSSIIATSSWEEYFEVYNKNNKDYDYIYYYNTKGREKIKSYQYFKCENEFVITSKNFKDSTFRFLKFKEDIIFKYVKDNFKAIQKFCLRNNKSEYLTTYFKKKLNDSTYNMIQIGIRYNGLHFNHFEPISDLETSELDSIDMEGQIIINHIARLFEEKCN